MIRCRRSRRPSLTSKANGLEGLFVTCTNAGCLHSTPFTFAALGRADDLQVPGDRPAARQIQTRDSLYWNIPVWIIAKKFH